jgi:hypothetical protein
VRDFLKNGGTVLLMLGASTMQETLRSLADAPQATLEPLEVKNFALLGKIDFTHPLFRPFADPRYSDFSKIRFWKPQNLVLKSSSESQTIASFDSGSPALIEAKVGAGKLYLIAASWEPESSQLALSTKFPVIIGKMLAETGRTQTPPSQQILTSKSGPTEPGLHTMAWQGKTLSLPHNLDPAESQTAPLTPEAFEQCGLRLINSSNLPADTAPTAAKQALAEAMEAESRQKLWRWFLGAVLALLIAETLVCLRRPEPVAA